MAQRVRIINKTKEGCTLDFKGNLGQKVVSWEEFNKIYKVVDNVWAEMTPEWEKKASEINDKVNHLVMHVLISQAPGFETAEPSKKLATLATIGSLTEELTTDLCCSPAELMNVIQQRMRIVRGGSGKKKPQRRKKENKPVVVASSQPRPTLGDLDALKELKAKMTKK